MQSKPGTKAKHIRIVAAGSPLIYKLPEFIAKLHQQGYTCDVICTPTAYSWLRWHESEAQLERALPYLENNFPGMWPEAKTMDGVSYLEKLTGNQVWWQIRPLPWKDQPKKPRCDAILVYPATVTLVGKIRNGIGDDLASLTCVDRHKRSPLIVVPFSDQSHLNNPGYLEAMQAFQNKEWRALDVSVLYDNGFMKYPPGSTNMLKGLEVPYDKIIDHVGKEIARVESELSTTQGIGQSLQLTAPVPTAHSVSAPATSAA